MALSNADKQRNFRIRQRARRESELKQATAMSAQTPFRTPFFEWVSEDGNWGDFELCLDMVGIEPPVFDDDSGARSHSGEVEELTLEAPDCPYRNAVNSLGRAEMMVGALIDGAATLARIVNNYKRREIENRIAEIERSDLSDEGAKKQALADIVSLRRRLAQLETSMRWSFSQWKTASKS